MSSPFQKAFMGKDPIKTIKLSDKDLKGKKSASSRPAKEISYEGQGGIDYENDARLAINPEGQGGIDYEAKDYKKKTSPLDSYSNPGQVKYFSNKEDFKELQNKLEGKAKDKVFNARIKKQGLDENSPEYKDLYVSTYGPLKPK
jgi:hypothetical protein